MKRKTPLLCPEDHQSCTCADSKLNDRCPKEPLRAKDAKHGSALQSILIERERKIDREALRKALRRNSQLTDAQIDRIYEIAEVLK